MKKGKILLLAICINLTIIGCEDKEQTEPKSYEVSINVNVLEIDVLEPYSLN